MLTCNNWSIIHRFLFIIIVILLWHSSALPSKLKEAEKYLELYVTALQNGLEEEAKKYWNKEEVRSYKAHDWQWEYLTFRQLAPQHLHYEIVSSEEKEGYVILEVEWFYREGKGGRLQKDIRYFVEEDGKMVGANPIFIHTRDWLRKESQHFVYHFKHKQDEPSAKLLERMDRFYEKVVDFLQVDFQDQIDYYKCDSTEEVGSLFNLERTLARSQTNNGVVASIQNFVPHEIVHIISYRILSQDEGRIPPSYLDEGLAYYLGGASFFSSDLMLSWAKKTLKINENIELDSLIGDPWIYGVNEGSSLVSSFVKFMIETYGVAKFKHLFTVDRALDTQRKAIVEIYGISSDQLQKEWKEFVLALNLPEVEIIKPTDGSELLHFVDPLGDDKGDGDYSYPKNEKVLTGFFDLTDFKISVDKDQVYFQLQFANLSEVGIFSDTSFNGTFTAIGIDSDGKEGSGNTQLFFGNGNFEFSKKDAYEFVIEVSHAGVLVYDQDWVWHLLFLKALEQESHIQGNQISFAIRQKIIGVPDSTWKFQVLTGGQKDGYENTAYGVGKFMKVGEKSTPDQGGGGTETNFNPDVYDILTPKGMDQIGILSNYDVAKKRKVIIPMIDFNQK